MFEFGNGYCSNGSFDIMPTSWPCLDIVKELLLKNGNLTFIVDLSSLFVF